MKNVYVRTVYHVREALPVAVTGALRIIYFLVSVVSRDDDGGHMIAVIKSQRCV